MNTGLRMALGALLGAGIGWALYKFVGCRSGACPLSSILWVSMLLWSVIGLVFARGL
jgi:hypothetical protein